MKIIFVFLASPLLLLGIALPGMASPPTSDRIESLTDTHGYYPCMDCHADQEPVSTPRLLEEEHGEPMQWEDDDGTVHQVAFGRRVAIADLLGLGGENNFRRDNLVRVGKRIQIQQYMENQGLSPADSVWALVHGGGNLWCLDCHDTQDRDKLVKLNGELLSFNQSHLLCGECHGPELVDWERGIHGKTTGYWDTSPAKVELSLRKLCVECHPAHDPAFPGLFPEPPPVPRVGDIATHPADEKHSQTSEKEDGH